jgi:chromosomal replication initiation ATPase DnaA
MKCPYCIGAGHLPESNPADMISRTDVAEWLHEVATEYGVLVGDIIGERRFKHITAARNEAAARLYEQGLTKSQVAHYMKRDHSTIIHAIKRARPDSGVAV